MLILAMIFWLGYTLSAPGWFWWCWGISAFLNFAKFALDMFKAGRDV